MKSTTKKEPPLVPRDHWLLGNLPAFATDPLGTYSEAQRRYGDVVRFSSFPTLDWFLVSHPRDVEHILQRNQNNYKKPDFFINPVSMLVGKGLLTSDGDFWLKQRRLAQTAFNRQQLHKFGEIMTSSAEEMIPRWDSFAKEQQTVDLAEEMTLVTLKVVTRALFGVDLSSAAGEIGAALKVALQHVSDSMKLPPFKFLLSIPTPSQQRFRRAKETLDEVVYGIIRERRSSSEAHDDLLGRMIAARDEETGATMSDEQLRDEVITLLLAGHETTASSLTWTWLLLCQNPDATSRLHSELEKLTGSATFADLPALEYTRMVLDESLRLYPPAWGVPRQAINEDQLGEYRIPAGAMVDVSQWVTHRRTDLWESPEVFDPERFSAERSEKRERYAYYPFGGGARQCIGNHFSMSEAQIILATLAKRFSIELVPEQDLSPDPTFVLKPKHGLKAKIKTICS